MKIHHIFMVALIVAQPVFAGTKTSMTYGNGIWINNDADVDVAYVINGSTPWNAVYGVQHHGRDLYHTGNGDDFAYIRTGVCKAYEFPDVCNEYDALQACAASHYDMHQVSTITIHQNMSCSVDCIDGTSTTCRR